MANSPPCITKTTTTTKSRLPSRTTFTATTSKLPLPPELVDYTLSLAWSSPLDKRERSALATTLLHTSRAVHTLFRAIADSDLHIVDTAHAAHFVRSVVAGEPSLLRCRRLTLSILSSPVQDSKQRSTGAAALHAVLSLAHAARCFPRIHTLTLDLRAVQASEVRVLLPALVLPQTIHTLRLSLAQDVPKPRPVPNGRLAPPAATYLRHGFARWHTAALHTLILDAPPAFADDLARACPALRALTLAWPRAQSKWWEKLVPLRSPLATLVLGVGRPEPCVRDGLERLAAVIATSSVFADGPGQLVVQVDGRSDELLPLGWEDVCRAAAKLRGLELSVRSAAY